MSLLCVFALNKIQFFKKKYMKQTLHKSLTADRTLHVSIVNEIPENTIRESSEFLTEQKGNQLFYKLTQDEHRYFKSLIVSGHVFNDDNDIKQSTISESRFQYFKAIQKTLLLQNENLKSHNEYLIKQIRQMFAKQKKAKRSSQIVRHQNDALKRTVQQFQFRLTQFQKEVMVSMEKLQSLYAHALERRNQGYNFACAGGKQPFFSTDYENGSISYNIQNMRRIFSKGQSSTVDFDSVNFIQQPLQNPQRYYSPRKQSNYSMLKIQQLSLSPRGSKKIVKLTNILQKIKMKLINLCNKIALQPKQQRKQLYFRKQKTIQ